MTQMAHSIGQIAKKANLSVSAVRYYENIGLIESSERIGGKRQFAASTIGQIKFIRRAQNTGFSLSEIKSILDDSEGDWRDLVDAKVSQLTVQRDQIDSMLDLLVEIRDCGCEVVVDCSLTHLPA